jgi:hypothetical protein
MISTFYIRDYVIIHYNIARIKTPDDHWYISTFNSRDYVIIYYNIARIKTPDDHWYISTLGVFILPMLLSMIT